MQLPELPVGVTSVMDVFEKIKSPRNVFDGVKTFELNHNEALK